MCGIAGIISTALKQEGEHLVSLMLKAIEHRGPDSNGLWAKDGFAFGMQRLSIIDIAGGDQPIWDKNGVGIIFNGEIYNFKTLRKQLENEGYIFKTDCDTEVILQLYCQKGLAAIQDLQGMFAICLYDPRVEKIYLIRDRMGVKPLYYYWDRKQFIFSSEIKAILTNFSIKPTINEQAVSDYLTLRYVPAPETIWDNVFKLEPAHYLEFDLQKYEFQIHRYWDAKFHSQNSIKKDYEKEFEDLFLQAVEKRLLASDVPVGILLSGGLDSSCVAAAAVELGHKNFHTFSVGFKEGGEFSELGFAERMAQHIHSQHHEVIIDQEQFINFIPELVHFTDEPLADLASIPLYYVSQLARQHVKVALSGEGADEILGGYNLDTLAKTLSKLKFLSYLPKVLYKSFPYSSVKILQESGYVNFLKAQATHMTQVFSEAEKKSLCHYPFKISTIEKIKGWYNLSQSREPLEQLQQVYCHSWLVEDLLMKADKMSMATSLELRVPFLDHALVEWAARLPTSWKVGSWQSGFTTKRILRRFAEKRLPKEIINRPKQGFPVPAYHWLQADLNSWAEDKLSSPYLGSYFQKTEITKILDRVKSGSLSAAHQAWTLIIFGEWLKRWVP